MPFRRRFSRERREWLGVTAVTPTTVGVGNFSNQNVFTQGQFEEFTEPRLGLIQGSIFVSPATAPAAATGYGVFIGLTKLQGITGATVTPDPETNLDYPSWLYWNCCFPQIGGSAAADSNASRWIGYFRFDVLIRSRLRFREGEQLNIFVKNSASSGAAIQYSFAFRGRVLAGRK